MAKRNQFEFPAWAEWLFENETAIKKAVFTLEPSSGTVEIGIFPDNVFGGTLGAYLRRDEAGKTITGTVAKLKEPSGLAWHRTIQQSFLGKSLN
jgi:hypothetical protein